MSFKKYTALAFLDEMIDGLCRGGPAKDRTYGCYTPEVVSRFPFQGTELTTSMGIRRVQPSLITGLVTFDLGSTVVPSALKLARASLEVLLDYDSEKILRLPIIDQLSAYLRMQTWELESFPKNAKYSCMYPLARFLRQEDIPEPPVTFSGHKLVYTGRIKRILKNRLVSFSKRNLSLFWGIAQGVKRGAEVVPDSFIHAEMVKHRAALTKVPLVPSDKKFVSGFDWHDATSMEVYFRRFFRTFRPPKPELFEASPAASFESKRSEGGARGFLRDYCLGLVGDYESATDDKSTFTRAVYDLLDTSDLRGDLLEMYEERPGEVVQVHGRATWSNFRELFVETRTMNLHRKVMVSAVLEPLKVRLITKGESFKYYLSRFYQKGLWNHLQKFPQFVLTGRPAQTSDFFELLDRERKLSLDFPLWVSGDYSAATDNLKIFYTKMAFEESLDRTSKSFYSEELKDSLRAVLYEQELHYPAAQNIGDLDPVIQETGQLMGSTESFPILCTVNLCAYWMSLERFLSRRIRLQDLPVLVNGDDILFRTCPEHYTIWKKCVTEVGFELSAGKNFVHPKFFTVNSTGFLWSGGKIEEVPYLNTGLLTGQSKLIGRMTDRVSPIWDYYNRVVNGAANPLRAHRRFLHYHRENVRKVTSDGEFSLFVDPLLGGLGFDLLPEVSREVKFTAFQRRFGYYLKSLIEQDFSGEFEKAQFFRGLVSEKKSSGLMRRRYHWGNYTVRPKFAPLNENEREAYRPESVLKSGLLAKAYGSTETVLRVRHPDRKVLAGFRSTVTKEARRSQLTSWPFRFVELV
jgi:hypothetical protein